MARPFNNYGPGLKITDGRVLPDFARDVLAGRDIVMFSDGSPTRTFCYSSDAITGYYKVLVKGRPGEAYNIGIETAGDLDGSSSPMLWPGTARELFGYSGKVVRRSQRRGGLSGGQSQPPLPDDREGARASSATTRQCRSTRG